MNGKYNTALEFYTARARRAVIRSIIAPLVQWSPLENPMTGYTVIVGCHGLLGPLLLANLEMLSRQNLDDVDRIVLVIDRPRSQLREDVEDTACKRFSKLPLEFIYYSEWQQRITNAFGWAWILSWLSWTIGIAGTRTKYVILHDFDALLLNPNILQSRFQLIQQRNHQYIGTRFYEGNGVLEWDCLAATYELIFNVQYVRAHFRPIDLFNHVAIRNGRSMDYDTFLWAQHQHGIASVVPIDEEYMVHPSQMICQFTELLQRGRQPSRQTNLPMLSYFFELGGESTLMLEHTQVLSASGVREVPFFGRLHSLGRLSIEHAAWLRKQASRLEKSVHGEVRSHVSEYFDALDRVAKQNSKQS